MGRNRIARAFALIPVAVGFAAAASAQPLDAEVLRLLEDDCLDLGVPGGNTFFPGSLGPNLDAICQQNAAAAAATAGGGSASSQGSDTLLGRKRAEGRIEETREGESAADDVYTAARLFDVEGLALWVSGDFGQRDREVTKFEDGYESDVVGGSAGFDYRFTDSLFAGLAFNYQNIDGDFEGGGDFDTDSYGGVLYGSFSPTPAVFVDAVIGYARKGYEVDRAVEFREFDGSGAENFRVIGVTSSDTDGDEISAKALAGYDHALGAVTVGPRAGINFAYTDIDSFSERGNTGLELVYSDRTRQSIQSTIGLNTSVAGSTPYGVLIPEFDVEWIHEFSDDQRHTSVRFVEDLRANATVFGFENEDPDRDFFQLSAGGSFVLPNGIAIFAVYRTTLGHSYFDSQGVAAGVRIELGGADS